jgi:hypothetical protein
MNLSGTKASNESLLCAWQNCMVCEFFFASHSTFKRAGLFWPAVASLFSPRTNFLSFHPFWAPRQKKSPKRPFIHPGKYIRVSSLNAIEPSPRTSIDPNSTRLTYARTNLGQTAGRSGGRPFLSFHAPSLALASLALVVVACSCCSGNTPYMCVCACRSSSC